MPIYEYQCRQCGARTEALQKLSDPPLSECSECGGELRKRMSAPAFQLKGSGWYVTDYAKKTKTESGTSSSGPAAETSSSEAAPEKKTESKPSAGSKESSA